MGAISFGGLRLSSDIGKHERGAQADQYLRLSELGVIVFGVP